MDTHRIVKGCVDGEPLARKTLYDKYSKQMYSICMRYAKNADDADDIFQQAFYLIYKNVGQLKKPEALSGWVKSIFVNTALEHIRKEAHFSKTENIEYYDDSIENWNEALSNLETSELTSLIQQLPEGCKMVFNLYIIEGLSHKEIAEKLSISVGTSKSQLHDARKILKEKIANNS